MSLTFAEYQKGAATTAIYLNKVKGKYPDLPEDIVNILGVSYAALGLGEVGETQGKIKKLIRDSGAEISDEKKKEIKKELGDICWYIAAMCKELNLSMEEVAQDNLDKLASRKERGVLEGSGDNR